MKLVYFAATGALLLALTSSATETAYAATYRATCDGARGSRVLYADNPLAPADQNRRPVVGDDAIDGIRLDLTYSTDGTDATVVFSGNVNTGGRISSMRLIRMTAGEFVTLIGRADEDESINLFSYFPALRRLVWTIHTEGIVFIRPVALAKTFMLTCR
jgi:hypothetical protein